jgi:hypothetical protein
MITRPVIRLSLPQSLRMRIGTKKAKSITYGNIAYQTRRGNSRNSGSRRGHYTGTIPEHSPAMAGRDSLGSPRQGGRSGVAALLCSDCFSVRSHPFQCVFHFFDRYPRRIIEDRVCLNLIRAIESVFDICHTRKPSQGFLALIKSGHSKRDLCLVPESRGAIMEDTGKEQEKTICNAKLLQEILHSIHPASLLFLIHGTISFVSPCPEM